VRASFCDANGHNVMVVAIEMAAAGTSSIMPTGTSTGRPRLLCLLCCVSCPGSRFGLICDGLEE
jgi:hypothetical protein